MIGGFSERLHRNPSWKYLSLPAHHIPTMGGLPPAEADLADDNQCDPHFPAQGLDWRIEVESRGPHLSAACSLSVGSSDT